MLSLHNVFAVNSTQIGQYGGLKDEVDALIRDKNVLTLELVRLRQQQQVPDKAL